MTQGRVVDDTARILYDTVWCLEVRLVLYDIELHLVLA